MKNKKAKITIEFQAENEETLRKAVYLFLTDKPVGQITGMLDVTATIDYPDKYYPKL